ncbi:MAG: efflux RND transporter periplasmic adaptor subunit [Pirellulales bacterium]|nr:efflux RND transporter periplasmic adaptor subunit [Pirellulales bacterium]
MKTQFLQRLLPQKRRWWLLAALLATVAGLVIAFFCSPQIRQQVAAAFGTPKPAPSACDGHDHANEAPDAHAGEKPDAHAGEAPDAHAGEAPDAHAGEAPDAHAGEAPDAHAGEASNDHKHDEAAAVKLSTAAQENVGLRLATVELKPFERTMTVPAMVVERPGRSSIQVAAPLTGVVTRVWPLQGETVTPGQPLFDLRLTHEEVVEAQAEFLKTAEELDVVQREIDRLEKVAADGVVSGKTLLERKYEQQKLQAAQRSQRQRLLLHGLSAKQVDDILTKRTLLSELTISVPEQSSEAAKDTSASVLQVQELKVENGQHIKAGDPLCVLADHSELFIQGKAFEQDAPVLNKATDNQWRLAAVIDNNGHGRQTVADLRLLYVANKIEPDSRAFLFYVQLPNKLIRNQETDGHRFSAWKFKPGQRVELLVPVERWSDRIVLPVNAVVQDGPESYVFEKNDGHFDRRAVRVEYRDEYSVVLANDGTLTPGKQVIVSGSYQVHLAMKNKSGGAPDPHAGHNH